MKGIILAGGAGTRLYPVTLAVSKQLLPVYDKPMIYYPLSVLMMAGIRDILIISTPHDLPRFEQLLGDGSQWGIRLSYAQQPSPDGLAQAFLIGEDFIGSDNVCMILGDNLFYGGGLQNILQHARQTVERENQAVIFGYAVNDPQRYGIAVFDASGKVIDIEEKPENPRSNFAVTGLYFYPNDVASKAKQIKPSARGELEITDLNRLYLFERRLQVELLGRGYAWLDTGTHDSMAQATEFIRIIEARTGLKIGCPEEVALNNRWINRNDLLAIARQMGKSSYADYLRKLTDER